MLYIDEICYAKIWIGIFKSVIYIVVLIFSLLVLYVFLGEMYYCYIDDICYGFNLNGILKSVIYIVVLIFKSSCFIYVFRRTVLLLFIDTWDIKYMWWFDIHVYIVNWKLEKICKWKGKLKSGKINEKFGIY